MAFNQIWRHLGPSYKRFTQMSGDGFVATPQRLQGMAAECGAVALAMLMAHYGRDIPLDVLRRRICSPLAGSTLRHLRDAAREEGFSATARRLDLDGLATVPLPAIVHLRFLHFAVLEAVSPARVRLNDPAEGVVELDMREFSRQFTGIVLTIVSKEPSEAERRRLIQWGNARWGPACLPATLLAASAVATPLALTTGQIGLTLISILLLLAGDGLVMRGTRLAARSSAERHAACLEEQVKRWPAQDMVLSGRYRLDAMLSAIVPLTDPLLQRNVIFLPALAACLAFPPFLAGLFGLAQSLLLLVACSLFIATSSGRGQRHAQRSDLEAEPGLLPAMLFAPVARWRLGAGPQTMFVRLSGLTTQSVKPIFAAVEENQRRTLLFLITIAASLAPAFAASGDRTLAMLWCGLMAVFLCFRLVDGLASKRAAETSYARLSDTPADGLLVESAVERTADGLHALEFRGVSWRPFERSENVLGPVSFLLPAGGLLAVEGRSGSGHSLLCRLSTGLLTPSEGQVLVNGHQCCGPQAGIVLLDGEEPMPRGSVRRFLAAGSDAEKNKILDLVELAGALGPRGGLDLYLAAGAPELSGGQRARLHLARALLAQPRLLVIDRMLDSVEAELAERILVRLRKSGLTLVVSSLRHLSVELASHRLALGSAEDLP
ncbi:ATP-binding cassette domain-containing protein [Rhizobium sp. ARZ01]|uniref:cysteine peptidase family C39 domain-containing protein n=1 Tax=Rhizobium sp. ARZ01 TaxID=2769313 RepID=UPI001784AD7C|nr:cysteine peptidase family C39 domain-containing protein [Rhizobium sp. ARZ01]MBD9375560.1 ATP-binding cassette domain-containing protein [Rhizobium sp. ARZ01]